MQSGSGFDTGTGTSMIYSAIQITDFTVLQQKLVLYMNQSELGTRQFFSFATTTMRQCTIASGTSQGTEKKQKKVRPQCLDGIATINIVKW